MKLNVIYQVDRFDYQDSAAVHLVSVNLLYQQDILRAIHSNQKRARKPCLNFIDVRVPSNNAQIDLCELSSLGVSLHSFFGVLSECTLCIRGFHKHTTLEILPILAYNFYYVKIKNSSNKVLPLVGIEPRPLITSDSNSSTLLLTII